MGAPRLAGLPAWYLLRQLEAFQLGWRGGHPDDIDGNAMRAQALALDDDDLTAVVAYAASRPSGPPASAPAPATANEVRRGRERYAACAACHGDDGSGVPSLLAPPLVGRDDWYLARQLHKFRRGERGYEAADHAGTRMRLASGLLEDESAVAAILAYLGSLAPAVDVEAARTQLVAKESAMKKRNTVGTAAAVSLALGLAGPADAEVRRHKLPDSDFPIAQAVEVIRGTTLVYHSGMVPAPANPEAERFSAEYWGDTETQTLSVFRRLEASLAAKGLTFGDVVKMQVFLVAPEQGGAMDFAGMMRAYRQFFGTGEQPRLPARSAFQVAGLAAPGMLVEIEVVLARP